MRRRVVRQAERLQGRGSSLGENALESGTIFSGHGYDSNEIRNILKSKKITPCILGRSMRNKPIENTFAKIKDWHHCVKFDNIPELLYAKGERKWKQR